MKGNLAACGTVALLIELDARGGRRASLPKRPGWFEVVTPGEPDRLVLEEASSVGRLALMFVRIAA